MGREEERTREREPAPTEQAEREQMDEDGIPPVEEDVQHVVAGRAIGVPEHGVVEDVRQRRDRPVETLHRAGPPVVLAEDQAEMPPAGASNPGVLEDDVVVIGREARVERVGVERPDDRAEREGSPETGTATGRPPSPVSPGRASFALLRRPECSIPAASPVQPDLAISRARR